MRLCGGPLRTRACHSQAAAVGRPASCDAGGGGLPEVVHLLSDPPAAKRVASGGDFWKQDDPPPSLPGGKREGDPSAVGDQLGNTSASGSSLAGFRTPIISSRCRSCLLRRRVFSPPTRRHLVSVRRLTWDPPWPGVEVRTTRRGGVAPGPGAPQVQLARRRTHPDRRHPSERRRWRRRRSCSPRVGSLASSSRPQSPMCWKRGRAFPQASANNFLRSFGTRVQFVGVLRLACTIAATPARRSSGKTPAVPFTSRKHQTEVKCRSGRRHRQWPLRDMYRPCRDFPDCGVVSRTGEGLVVVEAVTSRARADPGPCPPPSLSITSGFQIEWTMPARGPGQGVARDREAQGIREPHPDGGSALQRLAGDMLLPMKRRLHRLDLVDDDVDIERGSGASLLTKRCERLVSPCGRGQTLSATSRPRRASLAR